MFYLFIYLNLSSDGDDPEKISKMDDGSATAASQQAVPPTMPPGPPPPVVGGDTSGYGNYGNWYQVCFCFALY